MKKIRIFFTDIDGYLVNADIQKYVSQIELFGDDTIKDFEYIKNCIKYMLDRARTNGNDIETINHIEKVYNYVSSNMFEMLKEHRDCFLEYDNLRSFEEKKRYLEKYQENPVLSQSAKEEASYMEYIINALTYAKGLIEIEYNKYLRGEKFELPFSPINENNDIISYDNENPESIMTRAISSLQRMEIYAMNREIGRDDFLTSCLMCGNQEIVDYNKIYQRENIVEGSVDTLKYLLENNMVDMIVACSHYTGSREGIAKYNLFKKEFPFILMLPESLLKFHQEQPCMGKRRVRSSKDKQIDIMKIKIANLFGYDEDDIEVVLADDSYPNLVGLTNKTGILYRRLNSNEQNQDNYTYNGFIRQTSWDVVEVSNIFGNIFEKDSGKVLKKIK